MDTAAASVQRARSTRQGRPSSLSRAISRDSSAVQTARGDLRAAKPDLHHRLFGVCLGDRGCGRSDVQSHRNVRRSHFAPGTDPQSLDQSGTPYTRYTAQYRAFEAATQPVQTIAI